MIKLPPIDILFVTILLSTNSWLLFVPLAYANASKNPYQASKYRELGLSYRQQNRFLEAIAALKKAVELDPQNINGRVNLGWTLHLAKQQESAAEELLQAVYHDPLAPPTFNALGIVYLVSGELTSAVAVHTWSAVLKPNNEIAYYNLSLAFHRLGLYDCAITTGSQAAVLESSNPHPLVAVAIAYWDNQQPSAAKQAYQKAITLDARYRNRNFLSHLEAAAFTPEQIKTAEEILSNLN